MTTPAARITLIAVCLWIAPMMRADLIVCNDTPFQLDIAWVTWNGTSWVSEGWRSAGKGGCPVLKKGKVTTSHFFIYASNDARGVWFGDSNPRQQFCVKSTVFEFHAPGGGARCGTNYVAKPFRKIVTGPDQRKDFTYRITCPTCGPAILHAALASPHELITVTERADSGSTEYVGGKKAEKTYTITLPPGYGYVAHQVRTVSKNTPGGGAAGCEVSPMNNGATVRAWARPGGWLFDRPRSWIQCDVSVTGRKGVAYVPPTPPTPSVPHLTVNCICLRNGTVEAHMFRQPLGPLPRPGAVVIVATNEICNGCVNGTSIQGWQKIRVTRVATNAAFEYNASIFGTRVP